MVSAVIQYKLGEDRLTICQTTDAAAVRAVALSCLAEAQVEAEKVSEMDDVLGIAARARCDALVRMIEATTGESPAPEDMRIARNGKHDEHKS
ncbi:MAG: hypothetical protein HYR74_06805 [Candidatus Eisenbacteria bacterium]|nr:hypothetical protein [Candidatus Eisenbacteria bacterium]